MTVSPVSSSPPRRSPLPLALALAFAGMPAAWAQSEAVPPGGAVLAPVIVLDTKEQAAPPATTLGPQELAHLVDPLMLAGQCVGPNGCQQLADLTCAHCTAPSSSGSLVRTLAVHALTRIIKTAPTPKATGSG